MQDAMREYDRQISRPWSEFEWEAVLREREADEEETVTEMDDEGAEDVIERNFAGQEEGEIREISMEDLAALIDSVEVQAGAPSFAEEFLFSSLGRSEEIAEGFGVSAHPLVVTFRELVDAIYKIAYGGSGNDPEDRASWLLCSVSWAASHLASAIATTGSGEPGLTIAHLKRCLGELGDAIGVLAGQGIDPVFGGQSYRFLRMLFSLREGVVDMLRESRSEWVQLAGGSE